MKNLIYQRYLSTLYSHPEWPNCSTTTVSEELKQRIEDHPDKVTANVPSYIAKAIEKIKQGQPWSFTDIFGQMVGETLLRDVCKNKVTLFRDQYVNYKSTVVVRKSLEKKMYKNSIHF